MQGVRGPLRGCERPLGSTLHCTALHCTSFHCTALHFISLHCTALHFTALHCTSFHCTSLYIIQTHSHARSITSYLRNNFDVGVIHCHVDHLVMERQARLERTQSTNAARTRPDPRQLTGPRHRNIAHRTQPPPLRRPCCPRVTGPCAFSFCTWRPAVTSLKQARQAVASGPGSVYVGHHLWLTGKESPFQLSLCLA